MSVTHAIDGLMMVVRGRTRQATTRQYNLVSSTYKSRQADRGQPIFVNSIADLQHFRPNKQQLLLWQSV